MVYYVEIAVLLCICLIYPFVYESKGMRQATMIAALIVLGAVAGLRGSHVGLDTPSYLAKFQYISSIPFRNLYDCWKLGYIHMEIGFIYLTKILSVLFHNPQSLLIFCAAVYMYTVYRFASYMKMSGPGFAVFCLSLSPYLMTFNLMRQGLAVSLVLLAWMNLDKHKIRALCLFALALSCHMTALVFVVFAVAHFIKPRRAYLLLAFAGCIILAVAGIPILMLILRFFPTYAARYGVYGTYHSMTTGANLSVLLWMVLFCFAVWLFIDTDWKRFPDRNRFEIIVYSLLCVAFYYLGNRMGGVQRVAMYFQMFWIPLVYETGTTLKRSSKTLFYLIMGLGSILFFILQVRVPQFGSYKFFWNN